MISLNGIINFEPELEAVLASAHCLMTADALVYSLVNAFPFLWFVMMGSRLTTGEQVAREANRKVNVSSPWIDWVKMLLESAKNR